MRRWSTLVMLIAWMLAIAPAQAAKPFVASAGSVNLAGVFLSATAGQPSALLSKWKRVLARTGGGRDACPAAVEGCRAWRRMAAALDGVRDRATLLARVNDAANALPYGADARVWGASDYWATPAEFLRRGGDCEDFAIAKYFLLRERGVPDEAMRIAVVRDVARRLMHAVLVVDTAAGPMVLDNVVPEVLPAGRVVNYRPLFTINQAALWSYLDVQGSSAAGR